MKKEISFWKTQWGNIVVATLMSATAFVNLFQVALADPAASATNEMVRHAIMAAIFFTCMTIWLITAVINYNALKVEQLEKRIEALETCAITDIDQVAINNYVCKRRLGPDVED